jgi:S1-C subfamily serine protease
MRRILILIALSLFLFPITISAQNAAIVHPKIRNAYEGTCAITTNNSLIGTGVLLENGYIVTAAHVVDHNDNKKLDDIEKKVTVYFFLTHLAVDCKVVAFGDVTKTEPEGVFLDIAVLEPAIKIKSKVKFRKGQTLIGTPIFAIGMTLGSPPCITSGYINYPFNKYLGRASALIYKGNSGGGIFDSETQECLGIVIKVAGEKVRIRVGPFMTIINQPICQLSQYIPSQRILKIINHIEKKKHGAKLLKFLKKLHELEHQKEGKEAPKKEKRKTKRYF